MRRSTATALEAVLLWTERTAWDLHDAGSPAVRRGWRLHAYLVGNEARRALGLFRYYASPGVRRWPETTDGIGSRRLVERALADARIAEREAGVRPVAIAWAIDVLQQGMEEPRCDCSS